MRHDPSLATRAEHEDDGEHGALYDTEQLCHNIERCLVRPMEVLEHEDQGLSGGQTLDDLDKCSECLRPQLRRLQVRDSVAEFLGRLDGQDPREEGRRLRDTALSGARAEFIDPAPGFGGRLSVAEARQ